MKVKIVVNEEGYFLQDRWGRYLDIRSVDKRKPVFGPVRNNSNAILRVDRASIEQVAYHYGLTIVKKF